MRSSAYGIGLHPDLENLLRRGDPSAKQYLEALRIAQADRRQRKSQWALADSIAGLTLLDDGGVRPADAISTLIQQDTAETAFFTDAELDRQLPFTVAVVEWGGTEPADIEIRQVIAKLHPRRDPLQAKTVAKWRLDLLFVMRVGGTLGFPARRQLFCAPLVEPLYVDAVGDAEGYVTFDYSVAPAIARPKPKRFGPPVFLQLLPSLFNAAPAPVTLLVFSALKSTGAPATNVGLAYDAGQASVVSFGNVLSGRKLEKPPAGIGLLPGLQQPGTHADGGAAAGTPRIIIKSGTYTSTKIQFSTGGNRIHFPNVPTGDVVFTINGAVPAGTQLQGQVLKDGGNPATDADWVTFLSGQRSDQLVNVSKRTDYEIRANFITDASGTLIPTLRKLAAEEIQTTDLSDVARVVLSGGYGIDAVTLKGEIVRGTIVAIRDGERDYQSAIESLLATAKLGDYTFRCWVGAPLNLLSKDKWLHLDDYLPLGQAPRGPDYTIPIVSPLVKIRSLLPKYSPGASYAPDGDLAIGGFTTDTGAGVNLYQRVNETDADDNTYVQSPLDPVNATHKETLPTPADLVGRRLYLDYHIQKDVAGGKNIDATLEVRQSGALIATSGLQANISDVLTPGSFRLSDASVAAITDPANLELWITFNVGGAGGSRRGRLTWWRFRSEARRDAVAYSNVTIKAAADDILVNQLEIDTKWLGPGLENTSWLVSKVISEITSEEQPTSKDELDALAYLVGYGWLGSQGKLKAVNMGDPGPVVAYFPKEEVRILSITPGIEERIDEFTVPFNWNAQKAEFDDDMPLVHAAGVLAFGDAKLDPPQRLDQETGKWISPQAGVDYAALARAIGTRVILWFGAGRGRALIEVDYRCPEIEPGDTVAFEQDELVLYDPNTGAEIRGVYWVFGKVELCDDPDPASNRRFTVAFRPYADMLTTAEAASRQGFVAPDFYELSANADQAGAITLIAKARGGQSVKLAWSTAGEPTAATVRAAVAQQLDADGIYRSGTAATLLPDQTLYVAGFAYDRANGAGAESALMTAKVTFKYLPTLSIISARGIWRAGRLLIQATGNSGVGSMKYATSTASFPAAGTGTVVDGSESLFDAGTFVYADGVFVTITPYSAAGGAGNPGPVAQFRIKQTQKETVYDEPTGKPRRAQDYDDSKWPLQATKSDGTTDVSNALNPQASINPLASDLSISNVGQGPSSGAMVLQFSWPAATIYRPDGTTIAIADSSTLPQPPAPSLSQVAGGALGARTYFVSIGYIKDGGVLMYKTAANASLAVLANNLLKVASPVAIAGYDGYTVWVSDTVAINAVVQPSHLITPVAFGTDWTEPAGGATVTGGTRKTDMGGAISLCYPNLATSTTFYFYPTLDLVNTVISMAGGANSAKTPLQLYRQSRDGNMPLSAGAVSYATPAAAGSSGGSGGGSSTCVHPAMLVETPAGIVALGDCRVGDQLRTRAGDWTTIQQYRRLPHRTFVRVRTAAGALLVTPTHPCTLADGSCRRATELDLSCILIGRDAALRIVGLDYVELADGEKVSLECRPTREFYAGEDAPAILTHNTMQIS